MFLPSNNTAFWLASKYQVLLLHIASAYMYKVYRIIPISTQQFCLISASHLNILLDIVQKSVFIKPHFLLDVHILFIYLFILS